MGVPHVDHGVEDRELTHRAEPTFGFLVDALDHDLPAPERMVQVVLAEQRELRAEPLAVVLEPGHLLPDLRAVGTDLVAEVPRRELEPVIPAPLVEQ